MYEAFQPLNKRSLGLKDGTKAFLYLAGGLAAAVDAMERNEVLAC